MKDLKDLFIKHYPTVTKARKVWIAVISIVIPAIIVMILFNLAQSKSSQKNNSEKAEENPTVEMANSEDLNWYKNQGSKNNDRKVSPDLPKSLTPKEKKQLEALLLGKGSQFEDGSYSGGEHEEDETEKAKSAAITTNQIILDNNSNKAQQKNSDYLEESLQIPRSPYELQAGSIIPAVLITGINSDLPGQIMAQVSENVYDTMSGNYLLIPQGTKVVGQYDSKIIYGQERVLVAWNRLIFPNGKSLGLDGMPGGDLSGYAGFTDKINNHYAKIFGAAILMSLLGAGTQLSQPQMGMNNLSNPYDVPSVNQILAQSLGNNLANTGNTLAEKNMAIQPTLEIRPGYLFHISVIKDIVLPTS